MAEENEMKVKGWMLGMQKYQDGGFRGEFYGSEEVFP